MMKTKPHKSDSSVREPIKLIKAVVEFVCPLHCLLALCSVPDLPRVVLMQLLLHFPLVVLIRLPQTNLHLPLSCLHGFLATSSECCLLLVKYYFDCPRYPRFVSGIAVQFQQEHVHPCRSLSSPSGSLSVHQCPHHVGSARHSSLLYQNSPWGDLQLQIIIRPSHDRAPGNRLPLDQGSVSKLKVNPIVVWFFQQGRRVAVYASLAFACRSMVQAFLVGQPTYWRTFSQPIRKNLVHHSMTLIAVTRVTLV